MAIIKYCSCGMAYFKLPEKYIVAKNGDLLDGIYFDCVCGSTLFIRSKPDQDKDAA